MDDRRDRIVSVNAIKILKYFDTNEIKVVII